MTTTTSLVQPISALHGGHGSLNAFAAVKGPGGARRFIAFLEQVFDGTETAGARAVDTDDLLIHAECRIGDSCLLISDAKPDWAFTPALLQVHVTDCDEVLHRATTRGAHVITPTTPFYGESSLARFRDPWHNIWWLFGPAIDGAPEPTWDNDAVDGSHQESPLHRELCTAMRELTPPEAEQK